MYVCARLILCGSCSLWSLWRTAGEQRQMRGHQWRMWQTSCTTLRKQSKDVSDQSMWAKSRATRHMHNLLSRSIPVPRASFLSRLRIFCTPCWVKLGWFIWAFKFSASCSVVAVYSLAAFPLPSCLLFCSCLSISKVCWSRDCIRFNGTWSCFSWITRSDWQCQ